MESRPWDRQLERGETEEQYTKFCEYLNLPKRGNPPRRYAQDLADKRGCTLANISMVANARDWEERARAYDEHLVANPGLVAITERQQALAADLRTLSQEIRNKVKAAIESLDPALLKPADIPRLAKTALMLEDRANAIERPGYEQEKDAAVAELRGLLEGVFARGMGEASSGRDPGFIEATERKVRIGLSGDGQRPERVVEAVLETPRAVRNGGVRLPALPGSDIDSDGGS